METGNLSFLGPLVDGFEAAALMRRAVMSNVALNLGNPLKSNGRDIAVAHDDLA